MANTINVEIYGNAPHTPNPIPAVNRGDQVIFENGARDVVLCFEEAGVFGGGRFIIPPERKLVLVVQEFAVEGTFTYTIKKGDITASCNGSGVGSLAGGDEGGSGEVGGK